MPGDYFRLLVGQLPLLLVWITGGIALLRYRQLATNQRYLALLVWFDLVLESIGTAYYYLDPPNLFLISVVVVGEAGCFLLLYSQALNSLIVRRSAPWLFVSLAAYALVDYWLNPDPLSFRPGLQFACSLLELILASLYFRRLMNELHVTHLARDPLFLVSVGLVMYTLGDLLIILFSNYALKNFSNDLNKIVWRIHTLLNLMLYFCYALALWIRPPKPSS